MPHTPYGRVARGARTLPHAIGTALEPLVQFAATHRRHLLTLVAAAVVIAAGSAGHELRRPVSSDEPVAGARSANRKSRPGDPAAIGAGRPRADRAGVHATTGARPFTAGGQEWEPGGSDPRNDPAPGGTLGARNEATDAASLLRFWRSIEPGAAVVDGAALSRHASTGRALSRGGSAPPSSFPGASDAAEPGSEAGVSQGAGDPSSVPGDAAVSELIRRIHRMPAVTAEAAALLREMVARSLIAAVRLAALKRLQEVPGALDPVFLAEVVRTSPLAGPNGAPGLEAYLALARGAQPGWADAAARLRSEETAPARKAALELLSAGRR